MADLADFAEGLLESGEVRLAAPPAGGDADAVLRRAWRRYALSLPGPAVGLDLGTARRALDLAGWACWFLVSRDEPAGEVARRLTLAPGDAASADLVLSRLPLVLRRARLISRGDPLTAGLETLLRRWPLSGVLADIPEGPVGPVELGGHPGLLLLYAERLGAAPKPAWAVAGPAWPYIELVFGRLGLPVPATWGEGLRPDTESG